MKPTSTVIAALECFRHAIILETFPEAMEPDVSWYYAIAQKQRLYQTLIPSFTESECDQFSTLSEWMTRAWALQHSLTVADLCKVYEAMNS